MATKSKASLTTEDSAAKQTEAILELSEPDAASKAAKKTAKKKTTAKKTTAKKTRSHTSSSRTSSRTAKQTTQAAAVKRSESVTIPTEDQTPTQMPLDEAITTPEPTYESIPEQLSSRLTDSDEPVKDSHVLSEPAARSSTEAISGGSFLAADCIGDDVWTPSAAVPGLDEATYQARKEQAEAQRRAIEVASLNLKNINDLHRLEQQSIDVAISTKKNETRSAQLTNADIEHQIQLESNGEKSQQLRQATARKEAATRESDYADQLIALKDQNFELDIQQAQNVFAEKAARYRAQLTGQ